MPKYLTSLAIEEPDILDIIEQSWRHIIRRQVSVQREPTLR